MKKKVKKYAKKMGGRSSGRRGYKPKRPSSQILKKLVRKKQKRLGVAMAEWASRLGRDDLKVSWRKMDDDEIRGVTSLKVAVQLGVPRDVAPRVIAKVRGLVAAGKA